MQIFVGNLPLAYSEADLKSMFENFGIVVSAIIGRDKKTGTSAGYGIVEMPVKSEVRAAVDALREKDMQGKPLRVKVLKPGDVFHGANTTRSKNEGLKGSGKFRGDGTYRGSGAIRRGGQRGG